MASELFESVSSFDHTHYVPCLRWKLGEYQAILRLISETKGQITPLIEVQEAGWDFEEEREKKTVEERLKPFAKRVAQKWGCGVCFVDCRLFKPDDRMPDGKHPVEYAFADMRDRGCRAVPVTGCDRDGDYQKAVREVVQQDERGVCLRLGLAEAGQGDVKKKLAAVLRTLAISSKATDLVLDLGALRNFKPVDSFAKSLQRIIGQLGHRDRWRTFTLLGTSFPSTMGELERGGQMVKRYEWIVYKKLTDALRAEGRRLPTFGDYCIAYPHVFEEDMRKLTPAASLRYTVNDAWYILKGTSVRKNGCEQYRQLCRELVSSGHFERRNMCNGDAFIEDCAKGTSKGPGNLPTWRRVGTNRHIEKVVLDIASFFDS